MSTSHSTSVDESVGAFFLATAVTGGSVTFYALLHELLHVGLKYLATGAVRPCGTFGPLMLTRHRLAVCMGGNISAWNAMMTPAVISALGLLTMWGSAFVPDRGARLGLFAGGGVVWLREALYSSGWLIPPTVTQDAVTYWGDGRVALRAFGAVAQAPGALLLAAGALLLYKRLGYDPEPDPIDP
jgi:hypothetical protein